MHHIGAYGGEFRPKKAQIERIPPVSCPLGGLRAQCGHAFQIPRETDQGPFVANIAQSAQQELAEAYHGLDDPEHRFDRLLA